MGRKKRVGPHVSSLGSKYLNPAPGYSHLVKNAVANPVERPTKVHSAAIWRMDLIARIEFLHTW